jgi:hypothetical protein
LIGSLPLVTGQGSQTYFDHDSKGGEIMRKYLITFIALVVVVSLPGTALPWGSLTHIQGGDDLAASLPGQSDVNVFILATAGPDIAWTPLFERSDRTYIHSLEFAECLFEVASSKPQYPDWLDIAYGWGVHQAFDGVAHSSFVPENPLLHSLVELAVDTVIYYEGSPSDVKPLSSYHLGWDSCNPWLISAASRLYREEYDPEAKLVRPWMVMKALATLNTEICIEYKYIQALGSPEKSEMFLNDLVLKGILPGAWEDYYSASLVAAQGWIDLHSASDPPAPTPIPATLLLLGSGLLGLAGFKMRRPGRFSRKIISAK